MWYAKPLNGLLFSVHHQAVGLHRLTVYHILWCLMISKGSIAVDGVSLTLVEVQQEHFTVQLIPHTLSHTTLGDLSPGGKVNIETDILAKYVQKSIHSER